MSTHNIGLHVEMSSYPLIITKHAPYLFTELVKGHASCLICFDDLNAMFSLLFSIARYALKLPLVCLKIHPPK